MTIKESILSFEPLAYYLGMKPSEFWNCRYKEICLFCEMGLLKIQDSFKQNIQLNDATTDKLIQAHPLNKAQSIKPIKQCFPNLFKKHSSF